MNNNFKPAKIIMAASAFIQSQLIFVFSAVICIGGAKLLVEKLGFPDVTLVIGIILGVLSGLYGMFKFLWQTIKLLDKEKNKNDKG